MQITSRVKQLEKKLLGTQEIWAVFAIGCFEDPHKRELAENRLLSAYISAGKPHPTHRIFINDIPGPSTQQQEGKFVYSFSR